MRLIGCHKADAITLVELRYPNTIIRSLVIAKDWVVFVKINVKTVAKLQYTSTVTSDYVHRQQRSAANTEWNTKPAMFNFYAWDIVQALGATAHVVLGRLVFVSLNVIDGGQTDYPRSAPFAFWLTDSVQLLIIPCSISCIWSHFCIIIFFVIFFHLVTRSQYES